MRKLASFISLILAGTISVPAFAAPTAPTNVAVVSTSPDGTATSSASATVSWTGSGDAVSYSAYATDTDGNVVRASVSNCQGTSCSASLSGLIGGEDYDVFVTAVDNQGNETNSNPAVVFEARSVPYSPAVDAPALSNGQIVLSWTAPDTGGAALTKYLIRATNVSIEVQPNQTTYSSSNFTTGQNYDFTIVAVNSLGESVASEFTSITFAAAPSAPATPTATASGSTVTASWTAPANNGSVITAYTVYLVDSDGDDVGVGITPNPATSTSVTLNNVATGDYTVQVTATNAQGTSPRSLASTTISISSGTQSNTPVFNPATLVAMDIGTEAALSVSAPSGGQVTVTVSGTPSNACTYSGGRVYAAAAGTCRLEATVSGTSSFEAGSATKVITVKAAQTISFPPIESQTLPGSVALSATSTSGLAVRFSASGPCSVSGTTLSFSNAGSCSVTATQPGNNSFSSAQQVVRVVQVAEATSSNAGNPPQFGGSVPGAAPRPPGAQPGSSSPSKPSAAKVNAGSFKGYVALYAKGHKGKRFSAKVGKDWVIVPSLKSDFVRIVEYTGVGYRIAVRLFIDRNLVQTINLLTK